jgi:hypothetical protein
MNMRIFNTAILALALFSVFSSYAMELAPNELLPVQIAITNNTTKNYQLRATNLKTLENVPIEKLRPGKTSNVKFFIEPLGKPEYGIQYYQTSFTINDPVSDEEKKIWLNAMVPLSSLPDSEVTFKASGSDQIYIKKADLDKTSVIFFIKLFEKEGKLKTMVDVAAMTK